TDGVPVSVKPALRTEIDATTDKLLALDDASRREFVTEHPARDWIEFVTSVADRVRQEVRVDTTRAERLADLAIAIAETIKNPAALGKSLRAKANALYA